MAAVAVAPENESGALATKPKSPAITPQKVRELIDEGISPEEAGPDRRDPSVLGEVANGSPQTNELHFEATSKDAFFSRVETFTSLKWAGKPHELSPLICAKFGWTNVECDMLKCSSCQAYLCASLHLSSDFSKYKERCLELQKALVGAHEKFCFWPDSPCPDRFLVLLVKEPQALFDDFLERFQNLCPLQLQLPSLKLESLKNVALTEEKISFLLQLIEEEQEEEEEEEEERCKSEGEKSPAKQPSDILHVHITACILALCGWNRCPPSGSVHLPLISCCRCIRRVGLWGFQQMETPESEVGSPPTVAHAVEKAPLGPTSPRRMITRSQDSTVPPGSEQHEKTPSPVIGRTRGGDSGSERPEAEAASPTTRSRPVTRSMGHGEVCGLGAEMPSSPHRRAKRPRLYSSSSDSMTRVYFDPLAQHRDWCPWVNEVKEATGVGTKADSLEDKADHGWQVVLKVLQASRKSDKPAHLESESLSTKSRKVFQIFRQWEAASSP